MTDLFIEPGIERLDEFVRRFTPDRVLIVGEPDGDLEARIFEIDAEVRWTDNPRAGHLQGRLAAFRGHDNDRWTVVLNFAGQPADQAREVRWSELSHSDPLDPFPDRVATYWESSKARKGVAKFEPGDTIKVNGSGAVGRVKRTRRVDGGFEYDIEVEGALRQAGEASLTGITGDPRDPEFWMAQPPADAERIALTLTWTKLNNPLTDTIYSFRSSRTLFRTYQFRPVLKMINSDNRRLLIADEVGIGKTIEAGLIWNELEQRGDVESVLVIVPSGLRFKWQDELRIRFDRRVPILKRDDLREWLRDLGRGEGRAIQGIVTLEALRTATDILEELEVLSPRLDLVIVDEAHNMRNAGTKSHRLGSLLAEWADALVFLSATPLNLRETDLFNLLHILDEQAYPTASILQMQIEPNVQINKAARTLLTTGKEDPTSVLRDLREIAETDFGSVLVGSPDFKELEQVLDQAEPLTPAQISSAKRLLLELHTLAPVFTRTRKVDTAEHKAMREARNIDVRWTPQERAYYQAIYDTFARRAAASGGPAAFIMQMPLRQAASCLPAMREILIAKDEIQLHDEFDSDADSSALAGLLIEPEDRRMSILNTPLDVDTKFDEFVASLREALAVGSGQAMVFSFFRKTLEYLQRRLSGEFRVGLMYGPTPTEDRQTIIADFRAGKFDVLLCSEVGSEGLDFQFCNVLVNYDLPWNPMKVEQRIGRLDRFGQENEKIFIFNMQIPGTIETDILGRLYDRIGVFKRTIGDLEPILRDFENQLDDSLNPNLTPSQREERRLAFEVALESHEQDKEEISTTDSLVAGLDSLLIDGFEDDSPGGGRFVGRDEIRRFLDHYLHLVDGRMKPQPGSASAVNISGSSELAAELRRVRKPGGTLTSAAALAAQAEGRGFDATFDEAEAVTNQLDFLGVRHPLVGIALERLARDDLTLSRYGVVEVEDLSPSRDHLVALFLVTSYGIRPSLEILPVAVNAEGEVVDGVGDQLLSALAHGKIRTADAPVSLRAQDLYDVANGYRARLLGELERRGAASNSSLIDRRIAIVRAEFHAKIMRDREHLAMGTERGSAESYLLGLKTRIRNLEVRRDETLANLDQKRSYSIVSEPVAVVIVQPPSG